MKDSGGELTVKSQLQGGQLQLLVSDTGVGLPMEKMDQIFSAFFTTKPQGSGMGLAISFPLWSRMAAVCGRLPTMDEVQPFTSPCRTRSRSHRPWLPNAFRSFSEYLSLDRAAISHFVILTRSLLLAVSMTL
jgi:hypothetical protein